MSTNATAAGSSNEADVKRTATALLARGLRVVRSSVNRHAVTSVLVVAVLAGGAAPGVAAPEAGPVSYLPPGAHAVAQGTNWVLVKATAERPLPIESRFRVHGRHTGSGPLVVGVGVAVLGGQRPERWVQVSRVGGNSPEAAVVAGSIRERMRTNVQVRADGSFKDSPVLIDDRAKVVAVLYFVVNGVIDRVDWQPRSTAGRVQSVVRSGRGAAALYVDKPSDGASATAAGVGAGSVSHTRRPRVGIVGAMEWVSCQACTGEWTPPKGKTQRWAIARNPGGPACWWCPSGVGLDTVFSGPGGTWRWSWSGTSVSDPWLAASHGASTAMGRPVVAAYAPIGRDWKLFRN